MARPGDWERVAEQAMALLVDPCRRAELATRGRQRVEERFALAERAANAGGTRERPLYAVIGCAEGDSPRHPTDRTPPLRRPMTERRADP